LLEIVNESEHKSLLLIAHKISGEALNALVVAKLQSELKLVAVDIHKGTLDVRLEMEDLVTLSGAQLLGPEIGLPLERITAKDLGLARRVEATTDEFFLIGGAGNPAGLRQKIESLQRRLDSLPLENKEKDELRRRISRMTGSSAILKIGAHTRTEREVLQQKAEKGIKALSAALEAGSVPGGGTALLHCISPLVNNCRSKQVDEEMGCRVMAKALEGPFRQILHNARIEHAGVYMDEIQNSTPGLVFDVVRRKLLPAGEAGVLDAAKVLVTALDTAVSGALMALSTDVLILKSRPDESYEP
jgi:chaperonin GroEL